MTLKATGFQNLACFWHLVTLIEQGKPKEGNVNGKNKHLMLAWLFAALLIRTIYTSDIYSYLTKPPEAKNLPKTFN